MEPFHHAAVKCDKMILSSPNIPVDVNQMVFVQTDLPALPPCAQKVSKSPRCQTAKLLENRFTIYLMSAHSKCFSIQVNIRDGKLLPNLQSQKINYFCACSFKGKHAVKS